MEGLVQTPIETGGLFAGDYLSRAGKTGPWADRTAAATAGAAGYSPHGGGSLSDQQVEEMGLALMKLEEKVKELTEQFGLKPEDLNLAWVPLGEPAGIGVGSA